MKYNVGDKWEWTGDAFSEESEHAKTWTIVKILDDEYLVKYELYNGISNTTKFPEGIIYDVDWTFIPYKKSIFDEEVRKIIYEGNK